MKDHTEAPVLRHCRGLRDHSHHPRAEGQGHTLFGLSRQEAAIYLCLLKNEELTGYEVAKLTGISRSNVYNVLASLVEHGAAYVMEGTSSKYLAVALPEF